jgi:hypothetical protein
MFDTNWAAKTEQAICLLEEILSSAIILPVEESWSIVGLKSIGSDYAVCSATQEKYPHGLIIQPKK